MTTKEPDEFTTDRFPWFYTCFAVAMVLTLAFLLFQYLLGK